MAGKQTPTMDMRNFEKSKTDPAFKAFLDEHNKIGGRPSSAIQNYEHLQTLLKITDPAKRKIAVDNWWNTVRAPKYQDTGPDIKVFTPGDPGVPAATIEKGLTPAQELPYIQQKTDIELSAKYMDDLTRMQPKAFSALETFKAKTDFMTKNVEQAIANVSGWSTKWGAKLSGWPGSPAQALMMVLNTIKSNIGFQALQEMRLNSPTGGALGQVSEKELYYLQSTLGDLSQEQDGTILVQKLKAMLAQVQGMNGRLKSAYDMTFQPLTEAQGGDGTRYTIPGMNEPGFVPGGGKNNRRKEDDPMNLGL